jgi:hypothetical protein
VHAALTAYLGGLFGAPVEVVALRPLGRGEGASGDAKSFGYGVPFEELLEVMPPFLAFRALVIGHPRWYPTLLPGVREALLGFARALMAGEPVVPKDMLALLGGRA